MLSGLLTLLFLGIAGLVVLSVVTAIFGVVFSMAFGLAGFLLLKVAPLLLIGFIVVKLLGRRRGNRQLSAADQRWLDS